MKYFSIFFSILFIFITLSAQSKSELQQKYKKGKNYILEGKTDEGIKLLSELLSNPLIGDEEKAEIYIVLANAYMPISIEMALKSYEKAYEFFDRIGDKDRKTEVFSMVTFLTEDSGKQYHYIKTLSKMSDEITVPENKAVILNRMSGVYFRLGFTAEAMSSIKIAAELIKDIHEEDDHLRYMKGVIFSNLARYSIVWGDLEKAEISAKKALSFKYPDLIAGAQAILGSIYCESNDYKNGIINLEKGISSKFIPQDIKLFYEDELAICYIFNNEFEKALKIIKTRNDNLSRLKLESIYSYVNKEYDRAIYKLNRLSKILAPFDITNIFIKIGLGLSYEKMSKHAEAETSFRDAVNLIEDLRGSLALEERFFFFNGNTVFKRTDAYEGLIRNLWAQKKIEEAFYISEHLKARSFSEYMANKNKLISEYIPKTILDEESVLDRQIRSLIKNSHINMITNNEFKTINNEIDVLKKQKKELVDNLQKKYPNYAAIYYPNPLKHSQIKLAKNENVVEFEVTTNSVKAFLINGNGDIKSYSAKVSRKELGEMVINYRSYFSGIKQASDLGRFSPSAGLKLYRTLFGDLLKNVPAGNRLIIVPDEILGILPFDALPTEIPAKERMGEGEYGPFPLGVKYLGDKYEISYAQSATTLTLQRTLKKKRAVGNSSIVIADPVFSVNDSRIANTGLKPAKDEKSIQLMGTIAKWRNMGVAGIVEKGSIQQKSQKDDEFFPRLEKTTILVEWMKKLFGKDTKVLSGVSATEKDVLKTNFEPYRFITFATHGILDSTVPGIKEPALVLSQVGNDQKYDGFLTMSEVMGMTIRADVVALTACDTGLGKNVSGEGVMGLGRAFQYAGARNVLMSLWSVEEAASVDLTSMFFANLKEGKEPGVALKAAKETIRQKGYEHPFYWSSFVLMIY